MTDDEAANGNKPVELIDNRPKLYCSFCGKCQTEVLKLIAGPTVFICDECVALCVEIVNGIQTDPLLKIDQEAQDKASRRLLHVKLRSMLEEIARLLRELSLKDL